MSQFIGYVEASYKELRKALGAPEKSDDYKTSTEWIVTVDAQTFHLYDYKETNLYSDELPSVRKFRSLPSYAWHVGGDGGGSIKVLTRFLEGQLGRPVDVRGLR